MTKREIAILTCRILSIYLTVHALISVATNLSLSAWTSQRGEAGAYMLLMNWGYMALQLILGIALWLLAGVIAKPMTADIDEPSNRPALNTSGYLMVTFTTIGLYLLATAIISIVGFIAQTQITAHEESSTWWQVFASLSQSVDKDKFAADIFQLILGSWLFLGSRGLVRWLTRRREVDAR